MKIFSDEVFSKKEKEELLNDLGQIKDKLELLQNGSNESLQSTFIALNSLIKTFLTVEEKDIIDIQNKVKACLTVLEQTSDSVSQSKSEAEIDKAVIKDVAKEVQKLLEDSDTKANDIDFHATQASELLNEIDKKKNEFSTIFTEIEQLAAKSEIAQSKLQTFEKAIESVEDSKNKTILTQNNMRDLFLEVKTLHTQVFGGEEKKDGSDEVIKIEGLVDKLKTAYTKIENEFNDLRGNFEEFEKEKQSQYNEISYVWEKEFNTLKSQIESLLPGALSAGLSQAYEEKKNTEILEIGKSSRTFFWSIIGLTFISGAPVIYYIHLLVSGQKTIQDIAALSPNVFLAMLPVYIPCLWVAYSSDKKSKLSKRLAEEYAHKASLSKTFEGISRQVSKLSDDKLSADLESRLLYNLIQVSAENPGKLISDYDKSDHPLYEALDKGLGYSQALEKISFIPGVGKILIKAQKIAQKRIEDATEHLADEEDAIDDKTAKFPNV